MKGVTYDTGDNEKGKYRLCCSDMLDRLSGGRFTFTNRSRMGATLAYAAGNLQKLIGAEITDDAGIIIGYGGNDCDYDWKEVSESPDMPHTPKTPPEIFEKTYTEMLRALRTRTENIAVVNLPPIDPERYFAHISRGLSAENILHWLGDTGALYRWHEYYNEIVEKTAAEAGCRIIDIRTPFLRSRNYTELISGDGIHPTEQGHILIRDKIFSELSATLPA